MRRQLYCSTTPDAARSIGTAIASTVADITRCLIFSIHMARERTFIITAAATVTTTGITTSAAITQEPFTRHINTTAFIHNNGRCFYRNAVFKYLCRDRCGQYTTVFNMDALESVVLSEGQGNAINNQSIIRDGQLTTNSNKCASRIVTYKELIKSDITG